MTESSAAHIITKLPISRLRTPLGDAKLIGEIGREDIRKLLRTGSVRFVVADVGHPFQWHGESDCFVVWKQDVQSHLAEPGQHVELEQFPGHYAYFAARWEDGGSPVLLLSKTH